MALSELQSELMRQEAIEALGDIAITNEEYTEGAGYTFYELHIGQPPGSEFVKYVASNSHNANMDAPLVVHNGRWYIMKKHCGGYNAE